MRASLLPSIAVVLAACREPAAVAETGGPGETETGEPGETATFEPECPRLEIAIDGACERVEVVDVLARPFAFTRRGWTLEGTLRLPVVAEHGGEYRPPGVVIVHGSGSMSRDGYVSANLGVGYPQPIPVYRSLAEQLAARGFAVLTYDKRSCFRELIDECPRSVAEYPDDPHAMLVDDFLEDARVAARALAAAPEVAPDILLVGHSQSASFVALLVEQEPLIRAGVMLAGATLPLPETLGRQYEDLADWIALSDPGNPAIHELRAQAKAIRADLESIAAGTYAKPTYQGVRVGYWASWIALQAKLGPAIAATSEPLAGFYGTFDFNVGAAHFEQFQQWKLDGLSDATLRTYINLTHAFVYVIPEPPGTTLEFAGEVVDDLVGWAATW